MKTFTLRLNDTDHKLFEVLAEAEDMPISNLIRRVMKQYAREHGYLQQAQSTITQPTTLQPPLKDATLNNEQLLKRLESGEQLTTIAQSSNLTVSEVQARVAKAKKARTDGTLRTEKTRERFLAENPQPSPLHELRAVNGDGDTYFVWVEPVSVVDLFDDEPPSVQPLNTSEGLTEADADHNAEIARQRLLSMGLNL
jgi:hypothetical protein